MRIVLGGLLLASACGPAAEPEPATVLPAVSAAPADSLAFRPDPRTEVWFIEGRAAVDSGGSACYERGLEIRDSSGRRRVPLLYTLETPAPLDDTSFRARVYHRCRPGDAYRVSVATGRPTPLAQ